MILLPTAEEWQALEACPPAFSTKYGERVEAGQTGLLYGVLATTPAVYFAFPFVTPGTVGADLEAVLSDCGGINGYLRHATAVAQKQINQTGRANYTYEDVVAAHLMEKPNGTITDTSRR